MTQSPSPTRKSHQTTAKPSEKSAVIILLITIADTTWRAFVPTIGGTVIGVLLDTMLRLAPWCTIVCIILGFVTSGLLLAQQIINVRKKP